MRVPLSWLKEYVDLEASVADVADRLTFAGIEVEAIEIFGGNFDGIIVAEVRSTEKHPNADKLTVCRVFDGTQEHQVVCGAPNVKAGGKYPFAPIGTHLPAANLTIEKRKVRGTESFGMLCAPDELGIVGGHEGLLTLDPSLTPGTQLATIMGPPETVLTLEITPNRPDCLGMIGIAREIAAMYGRTLRIPEINLTEEAAWSVEKATRVSVEDTEGCPRYTARVLKNVKLGPSPDWMKNRLEYAGIRSINNVVYITNYVMLECGQPLHAFDQALLAEGRIVVRRAKQGEKMATLDGIERELNPSMLVIADATHPVAVAGVMGGAGSEIRDNTATVLLESAAFRSSDIRATARKLGLSTESSYRFERKVDVGGIEWASRRAASLMTQHAGATCAAGVIDVYPKAAEQRRILCRFDRVRSVVGVEASNDTMIQLWRGLGVGIENITSENCMIVAPTFRHDLEKEIDLIEEFARLNGLDKIPLRAPRAQREAGADDSKALARSALRSTLTGLGLQETMNYSLLAPKQLDLFDPADATKRIVLPNPISADQSVLRTSLIPQLMESLGRNRARQVTKAGLFELGRVFELKDGKSAEELRLCVGLMGPIGRIGFDTRKPVDGDEMFLWIKGVFERLVASQRLQGVQIAAADAPWAEPGYAVSIRARGKSLGVLGLVKNSIRREWRISDPVGVLEIGAELLMANVEAIPAYAAVPSFPSVVRDVAMLVRDEFRHEDIVKIIKKNAPPELESIELFDVFRGKGIAAGSRSVAYSLTFRSNARTLTDEEANGFHDRVKQALQRELQVEIR